MRTPPRPLPPHLTSSLIHTEDLRRFTYLKVIFLFALVRHSVLHVVGSVSLLGRCSISVHLRAIFGENRESQDTRQKIEFFIILPKHPF